MAPGRRPPHKGNNPPRQGRKIYDFDSQDVTLTRLHLPPQLGFPPTSLHRPPQLCFSPPQLGFPPQGHNLHRPLELGCISPYNSAFPPQSPPPQQIASPQNSFPPQVPRPPTTRLSLHKSASAALPAPANRHNTHQCLTQLCLELTSRYSVFKPNAAVFKPNAARRSELEDQQTPLAARVCQLMALMSPGPTATEGTNSTRLSNKMGKELESWCSENQRNKLLEQAMFPALSCAAWVDVFVRYSTAIPSSTSVERLFSQGSDVMKAKRVSI
ncbi:hypothetical protein GWK47_019246 [Chionoecetes opilio]|uniref:HAT C-terminal dimerisation domain-containing protein n=1 Tax=Chionoecetes opilio TaxID=41210 RepID=A0A8J4XSJ9_CHIOP|nr:hypothetical protein GWK47_019246 [Chionoecetes opilio]